MEDMDQLPGASDSDRSQFGERRDWLCMRDVFFDFIYREKDVFVVETDVFLSFVDATCFFTFTTDALLYPFCRFI